MMDNQDYLKKELTSKKIICKPALHMIALALHVKNYSHRLIDHFF